MEAVVLVGGQGTRLRPLTLTTPKPLLPVAGVPFLVHQLTRLRAAGVDHVVLATSYRAEEFARRFGDGANFGLRLDFATEDTPLGTGGGIRNVAGLLRSNPDDPVLVLNGDVLSGHDIRAQVARHVAEHAAVTLHLVEVEDPTAYGCVPTDPAGRVTAFLEKSPAPPTNRINAGCYVFRRSVIDEIPPGREVSVEHDTFPALLAEGRRMHGYVEASYWIDVGTPPALVRASADVVLGRVPGLGRPGSAEAVVDPSAAIAGATVTAGSSIGPGVLVAAGSVVAGSIVMAGAQIGPGCTVVDSVVGGGARIGAGCSVRDAVVGDRADLGPANQLAAGARLWSDATIPEGALRF